MSHLWTSQTMTTAMGGRPVGRLPEGVSGISIDSRSLQPGDAFFAIKGDRFDGHDFATAASAAGASLLVIAEGMLPALGRLATPMIVVEDVLKAMEKLAAAARARSAAKVIAVTGSAGKTTTKEVLRLVLSGSGRVHAADRSFNNHWGVPLTLARMPADCDFAVIEIGMNHAGEIRPLTRLARPHLAIVTLIAPAHLGHFQSLDEIARAKAEIFEGVVEDGFALINRDDQRWRVLDKQAKEAGIKQIVGFGEHSRAQIKLVKCTLAEDHSEIAVRIAGQEIRARVGAPGRHMVQNVLAALGAVHLVGADMDAATQALAGLRAVRGRGARHVLSHPEGAFTLIDESYNANPASVKVALDLLAQTPVEGDGRRIAVLGDMRELGPHSAKLHAALAKAIDAAGIDKVFLAGEEIKVLTGELPESLPVEYRPTTDELGPLVVNDVRPGDALMVKASLTLGFSRIVDALLNRFPAAAAQAGTQ
ncbi:UDP-N-acetylmuramoylalanyl-D-glutamyl-2,6-diaminopimelate--D-alanyl-D-alanine ligase [Mesorhizobium xinjiangense]|uniref:UDP-N-acetylmuramoylalanyl-D-glutamyl-2, 6-diaminopimelate--D-alanyl-D-alanine ligase n=1 Tax=Mesorhizobium xinjiangense TaxID=2678685 RepID=UPI0012EDBAF6|nr:UDP-N-acetylmuramoylalanyl-D-glutamyl-2,6-diaminopimelate--D-alanyl-D-alanine ligase [Mesorhizobium xinjiangense]